MTRKTDSSRAARAYMQQNPGVKYREALAIVTGTSNPAVPTAPALEGFAAEFDNDELNALIITLAEITSNVDLSQFDEFLSSRQVEVAEKAYRVWASVQDEHDWEDGDDPKHCYSCGQDFDYEFEGLCDDCAAATTEGSCPECNASRPFPVFEDEPNVFLPGSVCGNCGHVESNIDAETGDEYVSMDANGTLTHVDAKDYTTVTGIDDDPATWEAFAAPLKVDRWLVKAAIDARGNN